MRRRRSRVRIFDKIQYGTSQMKTTWRMVVTSIRSVVGLLNVKEEMTDIAVLDDVVFAFDAELTGFANLLFGFVGF